MLRELSEVLIELHQGVARFSQAPGGRGLPVAFTTVEITLPLEMRAIFRDGGCTLLAELPRSRGGDGFDVPRSVLGVSWVARPSSAAGEAG